MFARVKKSGKYQYLQLVENRKEQGRVKQRVIATLGRMDELSAKGRVETLIRSLPRFSERVMLIITGKSDVALEAKKIGPALIFERLWQQTGIGAAMWQDLSSCRGGATADNPGNMSLTQKRYGSAKTPCQSCSAP